MEVLQKLRWAIWGAYVVVWTVLLVSPMPERVSWPVPIEGEHRYLIGKTTHIVAYLLLAVLTGWIRARFTWRLWLLFFVMAHASATEWLQQHTDLGRTGQVGDIVLDHIGIALGLVVSWKWWTKEP